MKKNEQTKEEKKPKKALHTGNKKQGKNRPEDYFIYQFHTAPYATFIQDR